METQSTSSERNPRAPRKFAIRSQFGQARQQRSRKNRPCDACRRRKTACIITTKPPCLFCQSRGLVCQSASRDESSQASQNNHPGDGLANAETAVALPSPPTVQPPPAEASPSELSSLISGREHDASNLRSDHAGALLAAPERTQQNINTNRVPRETVTFVVSPQGTVDSRDLTISLEDTENRTAHYMGLAAEQDTHLLDSFRSGILSERSGIDAKIVQVCRGRTSPDDSPVHFLLLEDEFPEHTNRATKTASDAIEAIVWPHGPALVRLYFRYVQPAYPVVSKTRFLRQYALSKEDIPASLRGAVYALACAFWGRDAMTQGPCPFQQHQIVDQAHCALRRELEAPNLFKLQACLLLLHVMPPEIDSVETPATWILTAQATACAQMIGLHRDATSWNIESWEKSLRKKLWWACYIADAWSAVCHGNPPHISADSFDTALPDMGDLRFDEDVPQELQHLVDAENMTFRVSDGARFLETVTMARQLRRLLDSSFQVNTTATESRDSNRRREPLESVYNTLRDWPSLVPSCLSVTEIGQDGLFDLRFNCPLHLSYHATQVLLFRALMHPATKTSRATPGSNLRRWFASALAECRSLTLFMSRVTDADLKGFWGRHARSQLILCGNFLIYLFLLASEPNDTEATYRLLESFHQSLQRLGATEDPAARGLLRAARLRIDSFFAQAVELITGQE